LCDEIGLDRIGAVLAERQVEAGVTVRVGVAANLDVARVLEQEGCDLV